jgi:predicted ester cyclase
LLNTSNDYPVKEEGDMRKLFLILPLVFVFYFLVGCQDKAAMAELEAMKAQAEVEEQNIELTRRWLEEMDKGNLEIYDEICTDDYKCHFPWSANPLNRDAHKQVVKAQMVRFPDYNHTVEDIFAQGDKVVARVTNRGTHEGAPVRGIPPTGKEFEFSVIVIVRFVNGKVAEMWAEFDSLVYYQQLGFELKPKEEK